MYQIEKFIFQRIDAIDKRLQDLEGFNQASTLKFGFVTISTNNITIDTTSSAGQKFYINKVNGADVTAIVFRRYTPSADEVTDISFRAYHSTAANRVTYVTLDIYGSDLTTRDVFFQMNSYYQSNAFVSAAIVFGKSGYAASFSVQVISATGQGYIVLPSNTSDPAGSPTGAVYFNTTTSKIRGFHGSGWADL